nr:IS5 family transposase [Amycolatopsis azurea]
MDRGRDLGPDPGARDRQRRLTRDTGRQRRVRGQCRFHERPGASARRGRSEKGGCADWIEDLAIDGECLGRSRGGLTTKLHLAVDAAGLPLAVILTPGQAGGNPQLLPLLDEIREIDVDGQRVRVGRVLADKAYTHPSTRKALRERGIKATIPERADQIARRTAKGSAGGRPPAFDPDLYKPRNVVERCFNRLKQFRGLATRYAKRAAYHRAEIILACIILHLR